MKTLVIQTNNEDNKSKTPGEARLVNWKSMKQKSTLRLCADDDILDHYCERVNYLSYIQLQREVLNHPSHIGHGWILVYGCCLPVRNRSSAFPNNAEQSVVDIDGFSSASDGESDERECFSLEDVFLE